MNMNVFSPSLFVFKEVMNRQYTMCVLLRCAVRCRLANTVHCQSRLHGTQAPPLRPPSYFVQFQNTPNEECMKFFVEGVRFLAPLPTPTQEASVDIPASAPGPRSAAAPFIVSRTNPQVSRPPTATSLTDTGTAEGACILHLQSEVDDAAPHEELVSHYHAQQASAPGLHGNRNTSTSPSNFDESSGDGSGGASRSGTTSMSALSKPPPAPVVAARMTMSFDRTSAYLSPLATAIFEGLPQAVAEVTVGDAFITVRRAEVRDLAIAVMLEDEEFQENQRKQQVATSSSSFSSSPGAAASCAVPSPAGVPAAASTNVEDDEDVVVCSSHDGADHDGSPPVQGGIHPEDEDPLASMEVPAKYVNAAREALEWRDLQLTVSGLIMDHLFSGQEHITPDAPHPHADTEPHPSDSDTVAAIKELIATVLRPLVQQDGGDIRFIRFEGETAVVQGGEAMDAASVSGRVLIEMLGACKTCKSSQTTLKDMIQRTLQHWVPEVSDVVEYRSPRPTAHRR